MTVATITKLDKGQPITEMVRGSITYTLYQIRNDFYRQHPDTIDEYYWVEEIFDGYIIVNSDALPHSQYFKVDYEEDDGRFVFAERDEWELVELTYQPVTLSERLREKKGERFTETFTDGVRIAEAQDGKPRMIHGDGGTADAINGNGRRYRESVIIEAVADARHNLQQSFSQGRAILLGEEEHPRRAKLTETIVVWEDINYDRTSKQIKLKGRMVENSRGKDAIITMDAGVLPGLSLRAYGESELVEENGRVIEEVLWFRFTGYDLVMNPSFTDAGVTALESLNGDEMSTTTKTTPKKKEDKGKGKEVLEGTQQITAATVLEDPDLVAQIVEHVEMKEKIEAEKEAKEERRLREAAEKLNKDEQAKLREALGIGDTGDIITAVREAKEARDRLEAEENQRQVDAYIEKNIGGLKHYPTTLRNSLQEAVVDQKPATVEQAKSVIESQRKIFDKLLADIKLAERGHSGVSVLGPTLEEDTGFPEYAFGAYEITEGLRKAGHGRRMELHKKPQLLPSEVFTEAIMTRFDKLFQTQLQEESKMLREAQTTSDLNLPYSVTRAILEQAYPDLVAANVFDFGVMNNSPDRIYYESQFVKETGYENTVAGNNNVNAVAFDTWYDLPHARIDFDSISMQPSGGGTPLVFGVDYAIDFVDGKYMLLSGGSMTTATDYDFDYKYHAVRKGENSEIERAKAQLKYTTLEALADRLALQVTTEAILFSRDQVGWDAAMNSINLLIKELKLLIEKNLLHLGLSRAASVVNNIAGTWNSSTDSAQQFVQHILAAKTKVENRFYTVNSVVMSKTRGDSLILWDGFTAAGERPGFSLENAPGLLGYIAELPVFTSPVFPDSFVLVNHRELVQHRVYQPVRLKGPYPVYSNGKLVGAEEYYAEEFNGTVTPIPEKGSLVRIS